MKGLILLLFITDVPQPTSVVYGKCDYIEINHFHGADGKRSFTQLIGWSLRDYPDGFHVDWWRMQNGSETWSRDGAGNWILTFLEGETIILITAPHRYETATLHDPEVTDRQAVPKNQRAGLQGYTGRGTLWR